MNAVSRLILMAVLIALAAPAVAEPLRTGRYEMVRLPDHRESGGKVLILDTRTGELWMWSEPLSAVYAGRIFPVTASGPFVRIIQVDPAER